MTLAFYCHPHPLLRGQSSQLAPCLPFFISLLSQKPLVASVQQLPVQPMASHFSSAWVASLLAAPALPVPSLVKTLALCAFLPLPSQAACSCWRRSGSWLHYKAWLASPHWGPKGYAAAVILDIDITFLSVIVPNPFYLLISTT